MDKGRLERKNILFNMPQHKDVSDWEGQLTELEGTDYVCWQRQEL